MSSTRFGAVILSAGRSTRMGGRPKALLSLGAATFLETILARLDEAGIRERRVVVGVHAAEIRGSILLPEGMWVENPDPDAEMLVSFRLGLASLPLDDLDYVLLWPVDHPHVRPDSLIAVRDAAAQSRAAVVVPRYRGRRGHPVVFAADLAPEFDAVPPGEGARHVVHAHLDTLVEVEVDDPGVLRDVDTPADLDR